MFYLLGLMKGCTIPLAEDVLQSIQQCHGFNPQHHTHALYRLKHALTSYGSVALAMSMCRAPKNSVGACVSLTLRIPPSAITMEDDAYAVGASGGDNDDDWDRRGYAVRFRCGVGEVQLTEEGLGSGDRDTLYIAQQRGRRIPHMTRCITGVHTPTDEHMLMMLLAHLPDYLPEPMAHHVRDYALREKPDSILVKALLHHCNCFCEAPPLPASFPLSDQDDYDGIQLSDSDSGGAKDTLAKGTSGGGGGGGQAKRVCAVDVRQLTTQL